MSQTPEIEELTTDEFVEMWRNGDISLEDADQIDETDGLTVIFGFETKNGWVHLPYSLDEDLASRPSIDGEESERFDILEDDIPNYSGE